MSQERWDHCNAGHNWALILAGGDGTRLQALTRLASGIAIPKQFCSLGHSRSLLHDALTRASLVASGERTAVVLSEHHRRWWQNLELRIPARNLFSQPGNRGTAQGILLPLLRILHRDPEATLLVLPSDHYVGNELVLAASLREAMSTVLREPEGILLLGMTAEEADPELGYIVTDGSSDVSAVCEFVEKPDADAARALISRGGMWNSFIFAANGQDLLARFERACPDVVDEMRHIVATVPVSVQMSCLAELYARSPSIDFSRDILQRSADSLRVLRVPACGWSDLGTPHRVIETVERMKSQSRSHASVHPDPSAFLNLAGRAPAMHAVV